MQKKIDGLTLQIPDNVYDPAEDSFLLAENVAIKATDKVLEIGSGSGYVSIYLAKKHPNAEFFCIDINYYASNTTNKNAKRNSIEFGVICSDLFNSFKNTNIQSRFFDIIIFNSPYLPVKEEGLIAKAWSGGVGGLEVVEKFINNLSNHLKVNGSCFLVVSSKTNITRLTQLIIKNNFIYKKLDSVKEGKEEIILFQLTFHQ